VSSAVTSCAWCCCSMATREILKSSARVAYSVLFMFSMVFAWMLRDFAKPVISRIPCTSIESSTTEINIGLLCST